MPCVPETLERLLHVGSQALPAAVQCLHLRRQLLQLGVPVRQLVCDGNTGGRQGKEVFDFSRPLGFGIGGPGERRDSPVNPLVEKVGKLPLHQAVEVGGCRSLRDVEPQYVGGKKDRGHKQQDQQRLGALR